MIDTRHTAAPVEKSSFDMSRRYCVLCIDGIQFGTQPAAGFAFIKSCGPQHEADVRQDESDTVIGNGTRRELVTTFPFLGWDLRQWMSHSQRESPHLTGGGSPGGFRSSWRSAVVGDLRPLFPVAQATV